MFSFKFNGVCIIFYSRGKKIYGGKLWPQYKGDHFYNEIQTLRKKLATNQSWFMLSIESLLVLKKDENFSYGTRKIGKFFAHVT